MAASMTIRPRRCSDCAQALFGPGGVYCRVYHGDIFDETVAVDCGAFEAGTEWRVEDDQWIGARPVPVSPLPAGGPHLTALEVDPVGWSGLHPSDYHHVSPDPQLEPPRVVELRPTTPVVVPELERDQVLEGHLVVTYFGMDKHGDALADEIVKVLKLHYPQATVTWAERKEPHATAPV